MYCREFLVTKSTSLPFNQQRIPIKGIISKDSMSTDISSRQYIYALLQIKLIFIFIQHVYLTCRCQKISMHINLVHRGLGTKYTKLNAYEIFSLHNTINMHIPIQIWCSYICSLGCCWFVVGVWNSLAFGIPTFNQQHQTLFSSLFLFSPESGFAEFPACPLDLPLARP